MTNYMRQTSSPSSITNCSESKDINPKLVKVLKKILQPNLKLHNDDYLNLLLTHLTKNEDSSAQTENIKKLLLVWIKGAVMYFERMKDSPNSNILIFVINITKYICVNEQAFVTLNGDDIFERLLTIIKRVSKQNVTASLVRMVCTFIEHKSGLQWIISSNTWKLLFDLILNNDTIYVSKEGNIFISKLLLKTVSFNPTFCKNAVEMVLSPLDDAVNNQNFNDKKITSVLKVLNEVLTLLLKECSQQNEKDVMLLIVETYQLEKRVREMLKFTTSVEIKTDLLKLLIFLCVYETNNKFHGLDTILVSRTDTTMNFLLNTIYQAATEVSLSCMLNLLNVTLNLWCMIKDKMPVCMSRSSKVLTFEDQILVLHVLPVMSVFVKTIGIDVYVDDGKDEFRFGFISKMMEKIDSNTIRMNYKLMNFMLDNFVFSNAIVALKCLVHSKHFYNKDNGITTFQFLIYLISDLAKHLKENPQSQVIFTREPDYLALHLKVMDMIIDEYDVTWKDTVEALFVLNQMYELLNGFIWPTKIVVNALKLAQKAISKYMTFQMALLIDDDSQNSVMNDFPPLLNVKLHDGSWEVRDSTVELIHQFAITANTTDFSSYKRLMIENNFPQTMIRMATSDGSYFVRASALKCLQEIVKNKAFWDHINKNCNIYETLLRVLQMETEGLVRSEAALLICCIYEHQTIPDELLTRFYDAMSHAVVADLHWEVRINALKFWKRLIDNLLTQQGMIDGSFPSVTFSKQHKKIVTLNSLEIRKRLVVVVKELSQVGCLSVFYEALRDDCDLEVAKFATETITDFVNLLKKYDVSTQNFDDFVPSNPLPTFPQIDFSDMSEDTMDLGFVSPSQEVPMSDSILDEIVDTRDLSLLESVFNKTDNPVMESIQMKKHSVMNPSSFLEFVYTDLENRLNEKTKVIQDMDNFDSLLDDILKEYEPGEVNNMDCY